MFSLHMLF